MQSSKEGRPPGQALRPHRGLPGHRHQCAPAPTSGAGYRRQHATDCSAAACLPTTAVGGGDTGTGRVSGADAPGAGSCRSLDGHIGVHSHDGIANSTCRRHRRRVTYRLMAWAADHGPAGNPRSSVNEAASRIWGVRVCRDAYGSVNHDARRGERPTTGAKHVHVQTAHGARALRQTSTHQDGGVSLRWPRTRPTPARIAAKRNT